eukprot:TRINITY_DN1807_c0_g1_i1.p1 TRINITY_DN1807_c0_g1~~TRINITY_DN1807_c0_g1_i1.p1  ORF type:complete len:572 (-),score=201.09 TRINITY_DN1807_c0_g1_i1:801-2429(-)
MTPLMAEYNSKIEKLEDENSKMKDDLRKMRDHCEKLIEENEELMKELSLYKQKELEFELSKKSIPEEMKILEDRVAGLQKENALLRTRGQVNTTQQTETLYSTIEQLTEEKEGLEEYVNQLIGTIENNIDEKEHMVIEINKLQQDYDSLERSFRGYKNALAATGESRTELISAQEKLRTVSEQYDTLQNRYRITEQERNTAINTLGGFEDTISALKTREVTMIQEIKDQLEKIQDLESKISQYEMTEEQLRKELNRNMDSAKNQINSLESKHFEELHTLKDKFKQKEKQLNDSLIDKESLIIELQTKAEGLEKNKTTLENQLNSYEIRIPKEIIELRNKTEMLLHENSQLKLSNEELTEKEHELIENHKFALIGKDHEIENLRKNVLTLSKVVNDNEALLNEFKEKNSTDKNIRRKLNLEIDECHTKLSINEEKSKRLNAEIDSLNRIINDKEKSARKYKNHSDELYKSLQDVIFKCEQSNGKYNEVKRELQYSKDKNKRLSEDIYKYKERIRSLQTKLGSLADWANDGKSVSSIPFVNSNI